MADSAMVKGLLDNYIIVDVGANLTNKKFARDLDAVIQVLAMNFSFNHSRLFFLES